MLLFTTILAILAPPGARQPFVAEYLRAPAAAEPAVIGEILSFFLSSITTLFLVVDPPAAVPMFLSMTGSDPPAHKRRTARRAAIATGITLAAFAALGTAIFRVLGISMGAFRIAGGLLLFLLAVDMLRAQRSRQRTSPEEEAEGVDRPDVSIFPLAIPMLAGPGATSTVMVLVSRATTSWQHAADPGGHRRHRGGLLLHPAGRGGGGEAAGQTGMNVLQRVIGLILAATAVQFVVDGIATVMPAVVAGKPVSLQSQSRNEKSGRASSKKPPWPSSGAEAISQVGDAVALEQVGLNPRRCLCGREISGSAGRPARREALSHVANHRAHARLHPLDRVSRH